MLKRHNFISRLISYIGIILLFLVIFIVVYAPIIQNKFIFMGDYFIYFGINEQLRTNYLKLFALEDARFLNGFFTLAIAKHIKSSESYKKLRLIGIVGIALFATVIYAVFKQCRFRSDHAFLMSMLICTLPSMKLYIFLLFINPTLYGVLLSSLSAVLLFNVVFKEESKCRTSTAIGVLVAIILLVAALNLYQPAAMMYWTVGVIFLLTRNSCDFSKKEYRLNIITYFIVGLISMLIYYVVFIKIMPYIIDVPAVGNRSALLPIGHIPYKLKWFLTKPFKNAMNLWNMNPTYKFAIFIGVIIFIGPILDLSKATKEKKQFLLSNRLQKYFLILCLIILSYLPNLIVRADWYPHRTFVSLASALAVLFCFGLINIVEFFKFVPKFSAELRKTTITILLTIITIISVFLVHNDVKKYALLHSSELKYVKNVIQDYGVPNLLRTLRIYVRRPEPLRKNPFINELINEISPLTTSSVDRVTDVIEVALHEIGVKQDIQITQGAHDDPIPEDKNILVIDMTKFQLNLKKFMQDLD